MDAAGGCSCAERSSEPKAAIGNSESRGLRALVIVGICPILVSLLDLGRSVIEASSNQSVHLYTETLCSVHLLLGNCSILYLSNISKITQVS